MANVFQTVLIKSSYSHEHLRLLFIPTGLAQLVAKLINYDQIDCNGILMLVY